MGQEVDLIFEERYISDLSDVVNSPVIDSSLTNFHRTGHTDDKDESDDVYAMLKHDLL